MDEHMSSVLGFLVFFLFAGLLTVTFDFLSRFFRKSSRTISPVVDALPYGYDFLMENKLTGNRVPIKFENDGILMHMGDCVEPLEVSIKEFTNDWFIVNRAEI